MEARGNRTHFEDLKYGVLNWKYGWTVRSFRKDFYSPARPYMSLERPPYYFPSVLAFLCTEEQFNWEVEIYDVKTQEADPEIEQSFDLSLQLNKKVTARIKGLGIPYPTAQTVRFSEHFIPLADDHQNTVESTGVGHMGWKYWTEETELLDRTVTISPNALGLTDLAEYQKQWEYKAHGMLLDMAVYVE